MGSVSVGTVSIFVCLLVGRRCEYSFACMRVERMLVYMCACSSSSMCQVGPQTPPHSSSQSTPTPPTCPAGGGCRRCVGGFSRRGRMLEWAPAHSRRSLGGAWPYWPCWAPIGGWGAFGSPGPGPGPALVWSAAGGACGLAATAPWGVYTVAVGGPTFGLSSAFSGWRPRLSLRWFSWGFRALGGPRMFGARVFSMPASCLAGWGCCSPHTLLKHLHGGTLWTQARSHTQVYTQAFTLV